MTEQTDMDAAEVKIEEQRQWGEPQWLRALEKVTSSVNSARSRIDNLAGRINGLRDDFQALRDRVKSLEDRIP